MLRVYIIINFCKLYIMSTNESNKIVHIYTLDGIINVKQKSLNQLIKMSSKIKEMVDTSFNNEYIIDDFTKNELTVVIKFLLSPTELELNDKTLYFLNDLCDRFDIDILKLKINNNLLIEYLKKTFDKPNKLSPQLKLPKTNIIITDIQIEHYEKINDNLILNIGHNKFTCVFQKKPENHNLFLLSDVDYHVIKHKYKSDKFNSNIYETEIATAFQYALKFPTKYFDKLMTL